MSKKNRTPEAVRGQNERRAARRAAATRARNPALPPYQPRNAHGPQGEPGPWNTPKVAPGMALARQSVLTTPDSESRWDISKPAGKRPAPIPEEFTPTSISVYVRPDGTEGGRHVSFAPDEVERGEAMRNSWARHAAVYAGLAGAVPAPTCADVDTCTLYPLGDPHIGMLAWAPETGTHWDLTIATREFLACVQELVASAPASERAIITNLGDFLHAQDDRNMTPGHGNPLDVDGRFAKVLDAGHALLRSIVDAALTKHRHVTVRNLPGNHDPRVAAELSMWLRAVYEKEPRVTVADAFRVHQYDRFGCTLIGWTHGDRTPGKELPAVMAVDEPAAWGESTYRVWHTGHVHHETTKEYPGCDVETHGIIPPGDAYHAGRYRSRRRMSAITLHREYGEIWRGSVGIDRVHARIRETAKRA
jgi:hypothetical protein